MKPINYQYFQSRLAIGCFKLNFIILMTLFQIIFICKMQELKRSPSIHSSSNVTVSIRVRPALEREIKQNNTYNLCLAVPDSSTTKILISKNDKPIMLNDINKLNSVDMFTFDKIFWMDSEQESVYNDLVKDSVKDVFNGFNATIFAYGQTGSGKTFTMFGKQKPKDKGIGFRAIEELFSISSTNYDDVTIKMTCVEIYNEKIYDLLAPDKNLKNKKEVALRNDPAKGFFLQNVNEINCVSVEQIASDMRFAYEQRTTFSTVMNSESSRSHLILSFIIETVQGEVLNSAKLNIVDLAGSERVRLSNAQGDRFKEACSINTSLLWLSRVVEALSSKKGKEQSYIPFRESALTSLLMESLGGNCNTYIIATVSPSLESASETYNTLMFAASCKNIKNIVRKNESRIPSNKIMKKIKQEPKITIPWLNINLPEPITQKLKTSYGNLNLLIGGQPTSNKVLIYLHGHPSIAAEFENYYRPLIWAGYYVIGINQPGFGGSSGECWNCKSINNLQKGGPVDVLLEVTNLLQLSNPVLCGFDWGGGVCISAALAYPKKFQKIICLLPSYWEKDCDELTKLSAKTLLIWVPQDMFHNWKKWKSLAAKIKNIQINLIDVKPWTEYSSASVYSSIQDKISVAILKFLLGRDPTLNEVEVIEAPQIATQSTQGRAVNAIQNIILAENMKSDEIEKTIEKKNPIIEIINEFKKTMLSGNLDNLYRESISKTVSLFSKLPDLNPDTLSDPLFVVQNKIFDTLPNGWEYMLAQPRYNPGRQVLVKTNAVNKIFDKTYMTHDLNFAEYVTHKAVISKVEKDFAIVNIPTSNGSIFQKKLTINELDMLNAPHKFKKNLKGELEFEDGVRANYKSSRTKAKMLEIALKLSPKIANLNFLDSEKCVSNQIDCIKLIRKCLNITTFQTGVDKFRIGRTDSVGKLAINGQGQCHGVSTTMAAFLYPFSKLLGIELKYRGGFSFGGAYEVNNDVERHQWLEITLKPSMQTYVCDLFYAENDERFLMFPMAQAYQESQYPNGKLILGTTVDDNNNQLISD